MLSPYMWQWIEDNGVTIYPTWGLGQRIDHWTASLPQYHRLYLGVGSANAESPKAAAEALHRECLEVYQSQIKETA